MICPSHRLLHPMLLLLPFFLSQPALAQQHKAHVHGTSTLLVAVESDELVIELTAPADDIVGFEHAPRDQAQVRQVDMALQVLKTPAKMFALSAAAGCEVETVRVLASMRDDEHQDEHHKDDHHQKDDHAHDEKSSGKAEAGHDDEEASHSEFRLRYHFHCRSIAKLTNLDLLMFERFPRMHQVQVQMISAQGQKSLMLDHDRPRLTF